LTTETDPPITKEDVSVVDRYCELVRSQSDFAWAIFANLSVMAQDAGAPSKEADERAADLMGSWFSLNIRESEQWKQGTVYRKVDERPPTKEPTEAQKLAERTMKAIWAANDAVNERPPSVEPAKVVFVVEPPPGLRWSPGDRVRIDADGGPFMRDAGIIKVVKPTYCDVVLDRNGQTYSFDTNRLEPESNEEDPFFVTEAEIKVEGEDTPPPTTSKHYYGPDISKVTFQFTQTPNTLGTTDPSGVGSEDITIDCEYQLPGDGPFFVIRSDSGWSFDDPESFLKLLLSVKEAEEKCRCSLPQS
jgi:hypothetical protein